VTPGLTLRAILEALPAGENASVVFAFLNLGVIDSLSDGRLGAEDAVRLVYNAENCLFIQKKLGSKVASKVMSHGVQLPDLFDALPSAEAFREYSRELATMRDLCLRLIDAGRVAADAPSSRPV